MLKSKAIFIFGLVLLASFFAFIPNMALAGTSPVEVQFSGEFQCSPASTCTMTFATATTAGNALVIIVQSDSGRTQNTPTDAQGDIFAVPPGETCVSGSFKNNCIYIVYSAVGGTNNIVVTTSANTQIIIEGWEVRGASTSSTDYCGASATVSGTGSSLTFTTTTSCSFTQGKALLFSSWNDDHGVSLTAGTGYTTGCAGFAGFRCGFDYNGSVTSPTSFPWTGNCPVGAGGCDATIMGVMVPIPSIQTTIIPCTFFQLQCWWYPALMFTLVVGTVFFIVVPSRPSKNALGYILLSSLTLTSAVEVLMGLLPITLPLLLTVMTVIYAWRFT